MKFFKNTVPIVLMLMALAYGLFLLNSKNREIKLHNTKGYALVTGFKNKRVREKTKLQRFITYQYIYNDRLYYDSVLQSNQKDIEVGDSLLIEFSTRNPQQNNIIKDNKGAYVVK